MVAMMQGIISLGCKVIYVTGRPERVREETEQWLLDKGLGYWENSLYKIGLRLFMNKKSGSIPTRDFKLDLYKYLQPDLIIEDEPQSVRLFKKAGFKVLQVHGYRWSNEGGSVPYKE